LKNVNETFFTILLFHVLSSSICIPIKKLPPQLVKILFNFIILKIVKVGDDVAHGYLVGWIAYKEGA